jgi:hypothetical protein
MLVSRKVILLSALLVGAAMGVRDVVELRSPLVIFVMRSVVVVCGHN